MQWVGVQILKYIRRPYCLSHSVCGGRAGIAWAGQQRRAPPSSALPRLAPAASGVLSGRAHAPWSGPSRARTWISGSRAAAAAEAQLRAGGGLQGRVRRRARVRTRCMWAQAGQARLGFSPTCSPAARSPGGREAAPIAPPRGRGAARLTSRAGGARLRRGVWGKATYVS